MGTHHVCSRSLAGLLFLAALVALCCGGCGETVSKGGPAFEPAQSEPCVAGSEASAGESDEGTVSISDEPSADMAEAGVLGYSDPEAGEVGGTAPLTEDECVSEQVGDEGSDDSGTMTPSMVYWGEDRMEMIDEESNSETTEGLESGEYHESMNEETPCTPEGAGQECAPKPTGDMEQEYTPEPAGDGNDEGSTVVTPYFDGENETTTDGNCVDVTSQGLDSTMMYGTSWMWASDVRLVLNSWWQGMITVTNDNEVRSCEAYIPAMPPDAGAGESGNDLEPGPEP
jgi:hypothetical protein